MEIRKDVLEQNLLQNGFTKPQIQDILECIANAEKDYVDYMESKNIDYDFYYEDCHVCDKKPCICKATFLEGNWKTKELQQEAELNSIFPLSTDQPKLGITIFTQSVSRTEHKKKSNRLGAIIKKDRS